MPKLTTRVSAIEVTATLPATGGGTGTGTCTSEVPRRLLLLQALEAFAVHQGRPEKWQLDRTEQ